MARIFAFGGSTVYGFHDTEQGGFTGRLRIAMMERMLAGERPVADVVVSAVHGRTLPSIVDALPSQICGLSNGRNIGVFLTGASDSRVPKGQLESAVPLQNFVESLRTLGKVCAQYEVLPIFMGFPPIDDERTGPLPLTGDTFTNERLRYYNAAVEAHAQDVGAPFVETWEALGGDSDAAKQYLAKDGLHQSPRGHKRLFQLLLPTVDATLIGQPYAPLSTLTQ